MLRLQTEQNEQQARRRATVDMVLHERQDPHFLDARKLFASLRDKKVNLTQFACEDSSKNPVENAAIMRILNHYEFMAAGICEGAFDEAMYKRMKKSLVIADWHALSGYALEMRKHSGVKALFCEFERLATCWENHRPARLSP